MMSGYTGVKFLVLFSLIFMIGLSRIVDAEELPSSTESERYPGKFFSESEFDAVVRLYYMKRHFEGDRTQEAFAAGGWLDYRSPSWYGFSFGLTPYTSQKLYGPVEKDGSCLLGSGQKEYTVLGQAWLKAESGPSSFCLYRQKLDTPFLNPYDVKMTPVTFEAYTFENRSIPSLAVMVSHVTKIKGWNKSSFIPMSEAAGLDGTNEPVTMAGVVFNSGETGEFKLWNYYCHEFMNVVYGEAGWDWKFSDDIVVSGSIQGFDERSVGDELGGHFHTGMGGILAGIDFKGAKLTAGFTITDGEHDIVNPWGSYPGYTSIMEEDCDLAGEKAWVMGFSYDFERIGLKGLSFFTDHAGAWMPDEGSFSSPVQRESDFTLDYHFTGKLKGLWLRMRAAFVDCSLDIGKEDYSDYRLIINYNFPS